MTSAGRYAEPLLRAAWAVLALAVAVAFLFRMGFVRLPGTGDLPRAVFASVPAWPAPPDAGPYDWQVLQGAGPVVTAGSGTLSKRFRLAGTFFAFGGGVADKRKAIIEDALSAQHLIASEGDAVAGVTVARIFRDSVILRSGATEEQLWLNFSKPAGGAVGAEPGAETPSKGREADVGPTDKFGGRQVGDNRWVFRRQAIMDYYSTLRDEPERLVRIFDSMKPMYDAENRIEGYHLGIEGEADFFAAAGLREGDVVRKVNSMEMTSRRRAEYFIKEFVADRANAFIIDVERDGQPLKLMYEVR